MKKKVLKLAGMLSVFLCSLSSCKSGADAPSVPLRPFNPVDIKNACAPVYQPKDSADTIFWDDFEGDSLKAKNEWEAVSVELTSLAKIREDLVAKNKPEDPDFYNSLFSGKDSHVAAVKTDEVWKSSLKLTELNITENCYLTFKYFFVAPDDVSFKVLLNEDVVLNENGVNDSTCFIVKTFSVEVPAGTNTITFETDNENGIGWVNLPNALFIDDISLVKDKVSSLFITPKTNQKTCLECSTGDKVQVTAYPVRVDGTVVKNADINFSSSMGSVEGKKDELDGYKGYFIPSSAGSTKITATCNGITEESGEITVYEDKFSENDGACTIGGVTYKGTLSDTGILLKEWNPNGYDNEKQEYKDNARIDFKYPETNVVTADGFVRIKGTLTPSTLEHKNATKVVILVTDTNEDTEKMLKTTYIVDKDFDLRVWLPFGKEHYIFVLPAEVSYHTYGDNCEGDWTSLSWKKGCLYLIAATNTHKHTEADSGAEDGRFVYPSFDCQSDSYLIQNITNEVLSVLPADSSDKVKIQAIHDYIIQNFYYDDASIENNGLYRKKQDAVSVVNNGTAVCAGYTALTAAMARYAGIPARYITSKEINHAWNHVRINGTWYFCDTTWDDYDKDPNSPNVYYDYFLLTDFSGIGNDHKKDWVIDSRTVVPENVKEPELPFLVREGNWF